MSNSWERSDRWNTDQAQTETTDKAASWKELGTSMNAISFGFVATAILIAMFLIMAIFEHLIIRPRQLLEQSQNESQVPLGENQQHSPLQSVGKLVNSQSDVLDPNAALSVMMPGQRFPTFLAQPAPLLPCPREGVYWPSHHQQAFDCP